MPFGVDGLLSHLLFHSREALKLPVDEFGVIILSNGSSGDIAVRWHVVGRSDWAAREPNEIGVRVEKSGVIWGAQQDPSFRAVIDGPLRVARNVRAATRRDFDALLSAVSRENDAKALIQT